jgi:hypothetical protein
MTEVRRAEFASDSANFGQHVFTMLGIGSTVVPLSEAGGVQSVSP